LIVAVSEIKTKYAPN